MILFMQESSLQLLFVLEIAAAQKLWHIHNARYMSDRSICCCCVCSAACGRRRLFSKCLLFIAHVMHIKMEKTCRKGSGERKKKRHTLLGGFEFFYFCIFDHFFFTSSVSLLMFVWLWRRFFICYIFSGTEWCDAFGTQHIWRPLWFCSLSITICSAQTSMHTTNKQTKMQWARAHRWSANQPLNKRIAIVSKRRLPLSSLMCFALFWGTEFRRHQTYSMLHVVTF